MVWIAESDGGDIGYSRVSSDEQNKTKSIANQDLRLKLAGCSRIYSDVGSAYDGTEREEFSQLQALIQSGGATGRKVVVCNSDRLARRETVGFGFLELLDRHGVKLIILDSPHIDTSTPEGWQLLGGDIVAARAYSAKLSKRVKQGHAAHRERRAGYFAPFGYRKNRDTEAFELDTIPKQIGNSITAPATVAREAIETMLELKSARAAIRAIHGKYEIERNVIEKGKGHHPRGLFRGWDPPTFLQWLVNPILRGHIGFGRSQKQRPKDLDSLEIAYDTHPNHVLMSESEYQEILAIVETNKKFGSRSWAKTKHTHTLSSILRCASCNNAMGVMLSSSANWSSSYYQCKGWRLKVCDQKRTIKPQDAEPQIIEALQTKAMELAAIADLPDELIKPPELVAKELEIIQLRNLPNQFRYQSIIQQLESEIVTEWRSLQQSANQSADNQQRFQHHFANPAYWESLSAEDRREIYRAFVEVVRVKEGTIVEIRLKI